MFDLIVAVVVVAAVFIWIRRPYKATIRGTLLLRFAQMYLLAITGMVYAGLHVYLLGHASWYLRLFSHANKFMFAFFAVFVAEAALLVFAAYVWYADRDWRAAAPITVAAVVALPALMVVDAGVVWFVGMTFR